MNGISSTLARPYQEQRMLPDRASINALADILLKNLDEIVSSKDLSETEARKLNLNDIPIELLGVIFDYFSPREICSRIKTVSSQFYKAADYVCNESFWLRRTIQDFPDSCASLGKRRVESWLETYKKFYKYHNNFLKGICTNYKHEYPNNKGINQLSQSNGIVVANSDKDITIWHFEDPKTDQVYFRTIDLQQELFRIVRVLFVDNKIFAAMSNNEIWQWVLQGDRIEKVGVFPKKKVELGEFDEANPLFEDKEKIISINLHGSYLVAVSTKNIAYIWDVTAPENEPYSIQNVKGIIGFNENEMIYACVQQNLINFLNLDTMEDEWELLLNPEFKYYPNSMKIAKGYLIALGVHKKLKKQDEEEEDSDRLIISSWDLNTKKGVYSNTTNSPMLPKTAIIVKDTVYCLRKNDVILAVDLHTGDGIQLPDYVNTNWFIHGDWEQNLKEDYDYIVFDGLVHFPNHLLDLETMHSVFLGNTKCVHNCYDPAAEATALVAGRILVRGYTCGALDVFDLTEAGPPKQIIQEEKVGGEGQDEENFLGAIFDPD